MKEMNGAITSWRERLQPGSGLNWKREEQCPVNGNEERGYTVEV